MKAFVARKRVLVGGWIGLAMERVELARALLMLSL